MGDFIKTLTSLIGSIKAKVDGKIGILQKRIDDIPTETVLYTPQTLTEKQQKQVRDNIGSDIFVITITEDKNESTGYKADRTFKEIADAINDNMLPVCIVPENLVGAYEIGVCYYESRLRPPVSSAPTYFIFQNVWRIDSTNDYDSLIVRISSYNETDITKNPTVMRGSSAKERGTSGMVPYPRAGDQNKFLRGDATWADVPEYELPVASNERLGGVKPVAKTDAMTQDVGVDKNGKLYTESAEGGADLSLDITGASAGQIAKISAVDENGVPTAWTPADMPSSGGMSDTAKALILELFGKAAYAAQIGDLLSRLRDALGIGIYQDGSTLYVRQGYTASQDGNTLTLF